MDGASNAMPLTSAQRQARYAGAIVGPAATWCAPRWTCALAAGPSLAGYRRILVIR
jgi:hypothetical protein